MKRFFQSQHWENTLYDTLRKVSHADFKDEWLKNISHYAIRFISFLYKIIGSATFMLAFTWYFPKITGMTYETITTILLCLIILQLRYQKIKIDMTD